MGSRTGIIFLLLTIFFLAYPSTSLWCQVKYYSPENIYRFAEYLYENGDYLRAAGEFQRYFFSINSPNFSDSLLYKIGLCYQLGGKPDKSISYYQRIINNYTKGGFYDRAHYQIAYTHFELKEYNQSISYIKNKINDLSSENGRLIMNQLLGVDYLYQRRWETAHHHFSSLLLGVDNSPPDSLTSILKNFAIEGLRLHYKSEVLAGLMSAVIPGTGKVYADRVTDGLYSLFIIGLASWQAFDGFSKDGTRSPKGWIYGSLGTVFYLGNIYGSVVAVKIHNERIEDNFLNKIEIDLIWK